MACRFSLFAPRARLAVFAALALAATSAEAAAPARVDVAGTEFRMTFPDGRVLTSRDLVGAQLTTRTHGMLARVRIDAVETDPGDPGRGMKPSDEVLLHTFSIQGADGSWSNLCEPGPDGRRQGFPLAGRARADGSIGPGDPGEFVLTCTGGAEGKCIRFGYRPWDTASDGTPLAEAYNACVHLVRADYAGDGHATTRNGQPIDIYDSFGVQAPEANDGYDFEAGFTAQGAVCVRHVRVRENATLESVAADAPRLAGLTGDVCTEAFARAHGAYLFVRSP